MLGQQILDIDPSADLKIHHMDWATLRLLNAYRAFLLIAFAVPILLPDATVMIGKANPSVFQSALMGYFLLTGIFSFTISKKYPKLAGQFYLQSYLDMAILCVLMYSSGGVQSGISILLIILIAIISHCSSSKYAVLFAAMSSIMILTQEIFVAQAAGLGAAGFPQAAVTGVTLFAAGYLISVVLPVRQKQAFEFQHNKIQNLTNTNTAMSSDLRLAADLQSALLPNPERFGNADVAGFCKPAMYVGGDIYDYFLLDENTLVLYMADVVGHGAASAMISYAVHNQLNPREDGMCMRILNNSDNTSEFIKTTMQELNASFANKRETDHYFTLNFSVLNLETGEMHFSQAGHPFPIHYENKGAKVTEVGVTGMPIGMFEGIEFNVAQCQLKSGDQFIIFSDGATECFSPENEQFGVKRFITNVQNSNDKNLATFKKHLLDELVEWQQKEDFDDDVSILRIKFD